MFRLYYKNLLITNPEKNSLDMKSLANYLIVAWKFIKVLVILVKYWMVKRMD